MSDASPFIPHILPDVTFDDDGRVHVTRPKFGTFGTGVLQFFRVNPNLTLHLDDLGSAAWHLLDGRTVGEVRDGLQERFPHEQQLSERLGKFLAALQENKFIRLETTDAV